MCPSISRSLHFPGQVCITTCVSNGPTTFSSNNNYWLQHLLPCQDSVSSQIVSKTLILKNNNHFLLLKFSVSFGKFTKKNNYLKCFKNITFFFYKIQFFNFFLKKPQKLTVHWYVKKKPQSFWRPRSGQNYFFCILCNIF